MSPMPDRMQRVNSLLREVLADEIELLNDARLEMVSVTGVETAPDLRHAVVYVDVLGEADHDPALSALAGAAKRLQAAIGRQARLKYTPTLTFAIDPAVVAGERMEGILRSLRAEEDHESE